MIGFVVLNNGLLFAITTAHLCEELYNLALVNVGVNVSLFLIIFLHSLFLF